MKKCLLLISFFSLQDIWSQTNVYHPMPDSASKWCITRTFGTTCAGQDNYVLYTKGDTMIGSDLYHKLYATGSVYCMGPPSYYSDQYRGAFREDLATKKVYLMDPGSQTEYLICDFSLAVGAVGTTGNSGIIGPSYTITAIDSVLIGSNYRKRLWTNMGFGAGGGNGDAFISLIEGIGSTEGLLCEFMCQGVKSGSVVNAFMQNNQIDYTKNTGNCNFAAGIKEYKTDIRISPNPTIGNVFVSLPENTEQMQITNSLGEILNQKLKITSLKEEVDLSGLKPGIYFITIKTPEGYITRKIIKQ